MAKTDELTDMQQSGGSKRYDVSSASENPYPYGLCLRLENDQLDKLGIDPLPHAGKEYQITAVGKVTNVYESQSEGNKGDRGLQIQITHLALANAPKKA